MFKLSNEAKIGILAIVAIALAFWGFKFLKGINVLSRSQTFYVRFDNVGQLRPSSPIYIKGYQVGSVKDVYVDQENDTTLIVVLDVESRVDIPKNAIATIITQSIMGGKAIDLVYNNSCEGAGCAQSGDFLPGDAKTYLQTIIGGPEELDSYTARVRRGLTINIDSLAKTDPKSMANSLVDLQNTIRTLGNISAQMAKIIAQNSSSINRTMQNTEDISGDLKIKINSLGKSIEDLTAITGQLRSAGLDKSAMKANIAIDSATASLAKLSNTLSSTKLAISRIDTLAQGLVQGKGLVGKSLTDEQLYEQLVATTRHLHLLAQDIRLNPKRYNTVKLKLFSNKRAKYINPIDDPAYQHLIDSLERDYNMRNKGN